MSSHLGCSEFSVQILQPSTKTVEIESDVKKYCYPAMRAYHSKNFLGSGTWLLVSSCWRLTANYWFLVAADFDQPSGRERRIKLLSRVTESESAASNQRQEP